MAAKTVDFGKVSVLSPFSAPPRGYSECNCTGPEKPASFSKRTPKWFPIALGILAPLKILDGCPPNEGRHQACAIDPATQPSFDRGMANVEVRADPARVKVLQQYPQVPHRGADQGAGMIVVHGADIELLV